MAKRPTRAQDLSGASQHRRYMLLSRARLNVRVAILDDHPATTLGLTTYLNNYTEMAVGHAETHAQVLLDKLDASPCDAAIVDYCLPGQPWDGTGLIRRLRRHHPNMAILTFSADRAADTLYAAFRAGANGYVPKTCPVEEVADVLRAMLSNPRRFHVYTEDGDIQTIEPRPPASSLTTSEIEILRHIAMGFSVTQTAQRLLRSKKTISSHKRRAMRKLGLSDDLALALYLKERVFHYAEH